MESSLKIESRRPDPGRPLAAAGLLLLTVIGFWLRIRNLGRLGLVVDEGVQGLAVRGIVEHGLPRLETGLMYGRNLGLSYLQAAAAWIFGVGELSLRLPGVLFGTAAIPVSFLLARQLGGRKVALLTAAVVTFSVWQIEFARYGRFYAAFQCMFLVSLLCFYRGFLRDERRYRFGFLLAWAGTLPMHEMSALLLPCFALPLVAAELAPRRKLVMGVWGAAATVVWALYRRLNWAVVLAGTWETVAPPEGPAATALRQARWMLAIPLLNRLPLDPFEQLVRERPMLAVVLAAMVLAAVVYAGFRSLATRPAWRIALLLPLAGAAYLHQFGVVVLLVVVYLVLFVRAPRQLRDPALVAALAAAAVCFVFWGWRLAVDPETPGREALKLLFGFPSVYSYFVRWFLLGWPVMLAVVAAGSALLLVRYLSNDRDTAALFLLGALWIPVVAAGVFVAPWPEARYTFHLYPTIVVVYSMTVVAVGERLLGGSRLGPATRGSAWAALLIAALWLTGDARPAAAWSVGARSYTSPRDPVRAVINWAAYAGYHQDRKSPALYVRERRRPGEPLVVLGPPHTLQVYAFYVGGVDAFLGRRVDLGFYRRTPDGGLVERITGAEVLIGPGELRRFLNGREHPVWLLADRELFAAADWYPREIRELIESLPLEEEHVGRDGRTFAARIPPRGVPEVRPSRSETATSR